MNEDTKINFDPNGKAVVFKVCFRECYMPFDN